MNFEKLSVWKESKQLAVELYLHFQVSRDFGFKDQITRSGLSVPSNIAEGMSRKTFKDKCHFLVIAKSSCAELRTQIYIGIDIGYIDKATGNNWLDKTRHISAMLSGLISRINEDVKNLP
ncbi:four helix bundle protein [Psychromonas sp. KJ10-10]|uniref:four helix bundle protein n=1 Tax=Psychromonas sp. KJ10-10 TaxID=3391823 RepID=UPI0039B52191